MAANRFIAAGAVCSAALLVLTACSSSGGGSKTNASSTAGPSSSSSSGTQSGQPGVEAARAFADKYLKQATKIDASVPLPSRPPVGKTVYFIATSDVTGKRVADGFSAGVAALGWKVKRLIWTDPTQVDGLILQAVQAKADYIGYMAVPSQLLTKSLAAARAANIPVFQSFDATTPTGKGNWLFGNIGGLNDFALRGKINADYVISHSDGKANVLLENVPAFAVLKAFATAFKSELKKNCPTCGYAENDSPYADVAGGKVPATLTSYLRTHPKVNNVVFATGSFDSGVVQSAESAGLKIGGSDGIQITGQAVQPSNLKAIEAGQELAFLGVQEEYQGWVVLDGMARYSVGASLTPYWNTTMTPRIITKATATQGDNAAAPVNYQAQFKALWKVG